MWSHFECFLYKLIGFVGLPEHVRESVTVRRAQQKVTRQLFVLKVLRHWLNKPCDFTWGLLCFWVAFRWYSYSQEPSFVSQFILASDCSIYNGCQKSGSRGNYLVQRDYYNYNECLNWRPWTSRHLWKQLHFLLHNNQCYSNCSHNPDLQTVVFILCHETWLMVIKDVRLLLFIVVMSQEIRNIYSTFLSSGR